MILLSIPLKNDLRNHGKHNFFLEIGIVTTKIVNSKSLSASVDNERSEPYSTWGLLDNTHMEGRFSPPPVTQPF